MRSNLLCVHHRLARCGTPLGYAQVVRPLLALPSFSAPCKLQIGLANSDPTVRALSDQWTYIVHLSTRYSLPVRRCHRLSARRFQSALPARGGAGQQLNLAVTCEVVSERGRGGGHIHYLALCVQCVICIIETKLMDKPEKECSSLGRAFT